MASTYQVLQAGDGDAGWALIQTELPDIVLTDVMMPRLDGYKLTQLIKSNPNTDHIAVVMLTAKATQPSRLEGLQLGADDYLSKPFSVDELRVRVANLFSRQRRLQERVRAQLVQAQPASSPEQVQQDQEQNPFLVRIYALLDQHIADSSLSVEELAGHLNLERSSLHRKVKALTSLSTSELMRVYRLNRATSLLQQGFNSSETAYQVGFESPAYFAKCFREQYHMSPTEFARTANKAKV